ncbi:MAG: MarR family winged helix-turn-helix transcriptional regulator [Rhizobiaceae bacterium]
MESSKVKDDLKCSGENELDYVLDTQVGFLLRRATQRHLAIFFEHVPDLTSTQFATLAKLCELGNVSQNELGRRVAMDAATVKGVVDRLRTRGFAETKKDPQDQRRLLVSPTIAGRTAFDRYKKSAAMITKETLAPLNEKEASKLLALLAKLS